MAFLKGMKPWNKGVKRTINEKINISIGTKIGMRKKLQNFKEGLKIRDKNPLWRQNISICTKKAMENPIIRNKISQARLGKKYPKLSETKRRLFQEGKLKTTRGIKRFDLSYRNKNDVNFIEKRLQGLLKQPNKPEKKLIKIINDNNLPFQYVGDGKKIIGCFNPDFFSESSKNIIELFGDYWHNIPKNKIRDKERLEMYSKLGYQTIIIWEHELKDEGNILKRINESLQQSNENLNLVTSTT